MAFGVNFQVKFPALPLLAPTPATTGQTEAELANNAMNVLQTFQTIHRLAMVSSVRLDQNGIHSCEFRLGLTDKI